MSGSQLKALYNRQQCLRDKLCAYEADSRRLRRMLRAQANVQRGRGRPGGEGEDGEGGQRQTDSDPAPRRVGGRC